MFPFKFSTAWERAARSVSPLSLVLPGGAEPDQCSLLRLVLRGVVGPSQCSL